MQTNPQFGTFLQLLSNSNLRVLSTGGGGGGGQGGSFPPKHFHKIWQNTTEQLSYSCYYFLSAINKVQSSKLCQGRVLIEVASAIKFLIILFHSLASFTNNQRNGGWHFEPPRP